MCAFSGEVPVDDLVVDPEGDLDEAHADKVDIPFLSLCDAGIQDCCSDEPFLDKVKQSALKVVTVAAAAAAVDNAEAVVDL